MLTDPFRHDAPLAPRLPLDRPRRFTAVRRLQGGFAAVALVVVGAGAHRAGWLGADAASAEHTLQTARIPVAAAAATVPFGETLDTTEADIEAAKNLPPAPSVPAAPAPAAPAAPADAPVATETDAAAEEVGTRLAGGVASYYGPGFHGRRTANGERFDQDGLTAAHRTLPFGTRLRVTNAANGRSVVVRVNDRGPFTRGRVLDLSRGAARAIGLYHRGHGRVEMERLGRESRSERTRRTRADREAALDTPPAPAPATPVAPDSTAG